MTKAEQARLVARRLKVLRYSQGAPRQVAPTRRHFGISRTAFYRWKRPLRPQRGGPVRSPRAMTWAQRLKRVPTIGIEICRQCGGRLRVIASIEALAVIERIPKHLGRDARSADPAHPSRAPPQDDLTP